MFRAQDDPIREVWVLKGWGFLCLALALLALVPFYALLFGLSPLEILFLSVLDLILALAFLQLAGRYIYRLYRRLALPSLFGVYLAAIHGLSEAAQGATELARRWLGAKAAVLAWLDEDAKALTAAAASGLPTGWLEAAPPLSMGRRSLVEALYQGQAIIKPSAKADPWFGAFGSKERVVYVPLVSHERAIGVLALVGESPELGDSKLLSGLGVVLAIALDNCRLYEAERQRALHMQALARMKSDFLITVSHELRTPLTSIQAAAEMLLEEEREDPDGPRVRLVRNIVKGASRLTGLVADLVKVARQEDPRPKLDTEPIRVAELISNALAQVYPLLNAKGQSLDLQLPSPGPIILADRRRFEQIIVNLLSNAHRFTPSQGRIGIAVAEEGGNVVISVSDSGSSIPEGEREAIFEPFYKGERGGLGLGLAIARSLAELHGGRLWVEASDASGSTFCLAVPRLTEGAAHDQDGRRSPQKVETG